MSFILKSLIFLVVIGLMGLTGFAYFGNLAPATGQVTVPVVLDAAP